KHSTVSGHAVYGSAHRMFANTEGDVAAGVAPLAANSAQRSGPRKLGRLKIPHSLQSSIGRWIQISGTTNQGRNMLRERIHGFAAGNARRDWLIRRLPRRQIGRPVLWKLAVADHLEFSSFVRIIFRVGREFLLPCLLRLSSLIDSRPELLHCVFRQEELVHSRPAQRLLRCLQLLFTKRVAMGGKVVLLFGT